MLGGFPPFFPPKHHSKCHTLPAPQQLLWCLNFPESHYISHIQLSPWPGLKARLKAPWTSTPINYIKTAIKIHQEWGILITLQAKVILNLQQNLLKVSIQSYASMISCHCSLQVLKPVNQLTTLVFNYVPDWDWNTPRKGAFWPNYRLKAYYTNSKTFSKSPRGTYA